MERLRHQIAIRVVRAVLLAVAPAAAAGGCATLAGVTHDMHELVAIAAPNPATQIACTWQNRLTTLPDPLRNGAPTPGIAGQVYLLDAAYLPAEPTGQLTVQVSDVSPRPPGQPAHTTEVWNFTNATLKNLRLVDERMGRCYVVFLPWPAAWRDVTKVAFQVRYDQPNGTTLYSSNADVALDFTPGPNGAVPGTGGGGAVPNPEEQLKQAQAQMGARARPGTIAPPQYGVPQAGAWGQPVMRPVPTTVQTQQPQGYPGPTPVYYGPPPGTTSSAAGGIQPVAVPFRPPGVELATQGPKEVATHYPN
ncbi:MAG TPA: hypothetical protein VGJ05_22125 [Fimbriiglobus sp.]|jgi:hypothetical protein